MLSSVRSVATKARAQGLLQRQKTLKQKHKPGTPNSEAPDFDSLASLHYVTTDEPILEKVEVSFEHLTGADEGIAVISMNRPAVKNAIGKNFLGQLEHSIYSLKHSSARVVILRSLVDKTFCAGADLKERATMPPSEVAPFVDRLRATFSAMENLPMPTIAAIDGVALGGGLELALACDLRVASADSKMGLTETKLAIIPGAGGTQRLPRIVGVAKAKELIFTARMFDGNAALSMGLTNAVAESGKSFDAALALAREIRPRGPIALKMAKLAVSKGIEVDKATGFAIEEAAYAQVIPTKDRLEALAAFREKREPVFKGE